MSKLTVGWEEWLSLPDLGIPAIRAKIDTGAKVSSLHADAIERYGRDRRWVRFLIHPIPERKDLTVACSAPLIDQREVMSATGETELRYIIESKLRLGKREWPVEISLTNRENTQHRMLLGRQALQENVVVDPYQAFVQGEIPLDVYDELNPPSPHPRKLHIGILTREPDNYSSRRLVEAAESRGHQVDVIDTARCVMNISSGNPEVRYDGEVLPRYDAVIPRIGASITFYGMAVVRQFEMMGVYCLNPSHAIGQSRDKLFAHQLFARNDIGMPVTGFAKSPKDTDELLRIVGGAPIVLKLLEGTQGRGVVLAETKKAAESVIDAFKSLNANILVQQFVTEARGCDIRALVIGNKVVAAMMRESDSEDFRSNLHRGGKASPVKITKFERQMAVRAARVLNLRVAGVDLLRSDDGPKVIEVNSSPGLEGIERISGLDIAGKMVEFLEKHARTGIFQLRRNGHAQLATA